MSENNDISTITPSSDSSSPQKPDTLIIKGKFKFQSSGIYGIFVVIFNTNITNKDFYDTDMEYSPFMGLHIIVSYFSDLFHTDLNSSWSVLEKTFNELSIKGSHAASITNNFQRAIFQNLIDDPDLCLRIVNDYKNKFTDKINQEFDKMLSNIYKDRQIDLELFFEELSSESIASIKIQRIETEKPDIDKELLSTPSITINPLYFSIPADPILAPTGEGIPSNQLSPGIRILMKIDGTNNYGLEWIEIFKAYDKDEKKILPVVGTVDQIGPVIKNSVNILVKYQEEQYTKFNIESGIKLKLYTPSLINKNNKIIDPMAIGVTPSFKEIKNFNQLFHEKNFQSTLITGFILLILAIIAFYFNV